MEVVRGNQCCSNLVMIIRTLKDGIMATLSKDLSVDMRLLSCRIRKHFQLGRVNQVGKVLASCFTVTEAGLFVRINSNCGNSVNWTILRYYSKLGICERAEASKYLEHANTTKLTVTVAKDGFYTETNRNDVRTVIIVDESRSVVVF